MTVMFVLVFGRMVGYCLGTFFFGGGDVFGLLKLSFGEVV